MSMTAILIAAAVVAAVLLPVLFAGGGSFVYGYSQEGARCYEHRARLGLVYPLRVPLPKTETSLTNCESGPWVGTDSERRPRPANYR